MFRPLFEVAKTLDAGVNQRNNDSVCVKVNGISVRKRGNNKMSPGFGR